MADHDRLPAVIEGTVVERLVHAKRHPVVPAWIRDDVTRRAAAKYALLHTAHLAAFHGARSPKYLARTLAWSPRGLARVVAILARWAWDAETELLRSHAVTILLMFASVLIGAMPRMGETFALREEDYVPAAVVNGANDATIIFRHILPNMTSTLLVQATVTIPGAIVGEAVLSFLGLGVQPPTPSWGVMLQDAQSYLSQAPRLAVYPGLAIVLAALAISVAVAAAGCGSSADDTTGVSETAAPPASTVTPLPATAPGTTRSRMRCTSAVVASDCGELRGATVTIAARPSGLRCGAET